MNKELCFCIEEGNLYLEQVLVDYMDIPIFFLCRGDTRYYVALCSDIDGLNYIIVKVSDVEIYDLLHGNIPMRNIFLNQKEYWEVLSGEEISSDYIMKKTIDNLDISLLPEENACFKVLTEDMRSYVQEFDNEFLEKFSFVVEDNKLDLDPILINVTHDVSADMIEGYIVSGEYVWNSNLMEVFESPMDVKSVYVSYIGKMAMLHGLQELGKWRDDDTMNVAA